LKEYIVLKSYRGKFNVGDRVMLDLEDGTTYLMKGIVRPVDNTATKKNKKKI